MSLESAQIEGLIQTMKREIKIQIWDGKEMSPSLNLEMFAGYMQGLYPNIPNNLVYRESTGLKDKHGVEIYEGDIFKSPSHVPQNMQVDFIEGGFCATNPNHDFWPIDISHFYPSGGTDIEVIGNIYQNPELLK